jgi:hypothetical protein
MNEIGVTAQNGRVCTNRKKIVMAYFMITISAEIAVLLCTRNTVRTHAHTHTSARGHNVEPFE